MLKLFLLHPSRHSTGSRPVCSASTHLALAELSVNTMLAVIVALAILVILATCFLGGAGDFDWSCDEKTLSPKQFEHVDIGDQSYSYSGVQGGQW